MEFQENYKVTVALNEAFRTAMNGAIRTAEDDRD